MVYTETSLADGDAFQVIDVLLVDGLEFLPPKGRNGHLQ